MSAGMHTRSSVSQPCCIAVTNTEQGSGRTARIRCGRAASKCVRNTRLIWQQCKSDEQHAQEGQLAGSDAGAEVTVTCEQHTTRNNQ